MTIEDIIPYLEGMVAQLISIQDNMVQQIQVMGLVICFMGIAAGILFMMLLWERFK